MGQMAFFDVSDRYAGLDAKADPEKRVLAGEPEWTERSEIPSSSGRGDGQVRISSTPVLCIRAAPISRITAIGWPILGTTRNEGRVGLCQKAVREPEK